MKNKPKQRRLSKDQLSKIATYFLLYTFPDFIGYILRSVCGFK
jgi:hypothetical protein